MESKDVLERHEKARKAVADICEGRRKWTMSIPVRPDTDTDVVICDSLKDIPQLVKRIAESDTLADNLRTAEATWREAGLRAEKRISELEAKVEGLQWSLDAAQEFAEMTAGYVERLRVALGGYEDSEPISLAETLRKFYDAHCENMGEPQNP